MKAHEIHPDWKKCTTIEQLIEGLANNASLYGDVKQAWAEDARSCFARAFEISAERVFRKEPPNE